MQDYRKLKVWEFSHALVLDVYRATDGFPASESSGLTSQLRRSPASIPATIAEGSGRSTSVDFAKFLDIASGSASECEYQPLLAHDLGYVDDASYEGLAARIGEIKRMLGALISRVRGSTRTRPSSNENRKPKTENSSP
jgi:four helix bundle protein